MNAFAALADNTRREIVLMLVDQGELSATEISKKFSMTAPAVSQHLKILREAKIIHMKKQAQKRLYSVDESGINEIGDWLLNVKKMWSKRLDRLDEYLLKLKNEKKGVGMKDLNSKKDAR